MKNLSSLCINRPVLSIVMSLVIIIFGGIGYHYLGVREFPGIDPPVITVRTVYPGANAEIIESQITEPLEKSINGIAGIRSVSSASNQGSSTITVEFNLDEDLEAAANDVRDKVSQGLRLLPRDIDGVPVVTKADANSDAIIAMTVKNPLKNILEVSAFAENVIAERMQTIPGVSTIQVWGQRRYAMRIWLDAAKMAGSGITILDVKAALDREHVELPSGKLSGSKNELTIKTLGRLVTEEQFNELMISKAGGRNIRLRDVGYAKLGPENEETILKESGEPMIGLGIVPQPGANYVDIAQEFYLRLEQLKKELPSDYSLNIALDKTIFIKRSITEVQETLLIAILLVILIIYLFFRDWIIALRPLIDIPVSLIGAFFIMYLFGYSINVLTLLAIVLATGLVVDDGIVVTENIYKKAESGMDPVEAAHEGSREIFFAVISTSLTLAIVFLPIMFLEGFVGRLFREFGVVLAGAVLISAFVSLSLTPMLNARLVRSNQKKSRFFYATEPFFERLNLAYRRSLHKFLEKRIFAWPILFLSFGLIWYLGAKLPSELAPLDDRNWFRLAVTAPEGVSYEYTDAFMDKLGKFIHDSVPEKTIMLNVTAPSFTGSGAVNSGFSRVVLSDATQRQRSQQEIAMKIQKQATMFTEAKVFVIQEQTISAGGGGRGAMPVQFVLQAPDFDRLKQKLPVFLDEARKNPVFQGVDVDLKFNKPELNVTVDREKAGDLGISLQDVAQTLQLCLSAQRFAYFSLDGKQYQVIGQLMREFRNDPADLTGIFIKNNRGELLQLDHIVKLEESSSPPQLYHYNRYMSATVSAGLAPGKTVGDGIAAMREIAARTLDDSFATELTGLSRDFSESSSNILFAFLLALLLVYLVLAAQFESFRDPFIIMLTVPLALAGAILSLWYFNQTLNIFSQIGMIMLIGLVTKNGILIVEFVNQLRERGIDFSEAIVEASVARFRPILMTTLATILGALPIALALGAGSKSRTGMGIVVAGGLLFSLILSLYVIPAMYSFISSKKQRNA
jgi:hydrophobe/amphiphile efflux-1 (HAE1) family protein